MVFLLGYRGSLKIVTSHHIIPLPRHLLFVNPVMFFV